MVKYLFLLAGIFFADTTAFAQKLIPQQTPAQQLIANTGEDSMNAYGAAHSRTVVSGYGEVHFQRDMNEQQSVVNLSRAVLFVGHQFTGKIALFSELEIEDAKVAGGGVTGEVSMEQVYLKFSLNPRQYIVAGLFLPRIKVRIMYLTWK